MDFLKHIDEVIDNFSKLDEFIQQNILIFKNGHLRTENVLSLRDNVPTLNKIKDLIKLRDKNKEILNKFLELNDQNFVKIYEIDVPFSYARIFLLQSYLSIIWSIYDIIAGFGRNFHHKNKDSSIENCTLSKIFINTGEKNTKLAMQLLTDTLTNRFGLEIELCYAIRNIFLHTSGLELEESFIENKTVEDCFILTTESHDKIIGKVKNRENINNDGNGNKKLLEEKDLIKILFTCEPAIDTSCIYIIKIAFSVFNELVHSFTLVYN